MEGQAGNRRRPRPPALHSCTHWPQAASHPGKEQSGDLPVRFWRRRQKLPENASVPSRMPSVKRPERGLRWEEERIHWAVGSPGLGGLFGSGVRSRKQGPTPIPHHLRDLHLASGPASPLERQCPTLP